MIVGRSVLRNTVVSFLGQLLPLLAALVSMPFLLKNLGQERIGVLSLIWSIFGYFTVLDLGLGKAITKTVADALATDKEEAIGNTIWTAFSTQLIIGICGSIVLVSLIPLLVKSALNVPPALATETMIAFSMSALTIPIVILSSTVAGLLQAARRFDLQFKVMLPISLCNYLLPIFLTIWWPDLRVVVAVLVVTRCTSLVLLFYVARKIFPHLKEYQKPDKNSLKSLLGYGGWVTISNVVKPMLNTGDRFIMGMLITMSALAYYTVPFDLAVRMWIVPTSLLSVMFPVFCATFSQGDDLELARKVGLTVRNILCVLGLMAIPIVISAHEVMLVWMGADFSNHSTLILRIIAFAVVVDSIAAVFAQLIQAIGRADITAKNQLIQIPFFFLSVWIAVKIWGELGAAIAWSFRVLVDFIIFFVSMRKTTGIGIRTFINVRVPEISVFFFSICLAATLFVSRIETTILRISFAGGVSIFSALVVWRFFLDVSEREKLSMILRKYISKRQV
jgi:O-antigen/teichoic acid export membrane protein